MQRESERGMLCPSCRSYNRASASFCVNCGTLLTPRSRRRFAHGWLVRPLLLLCIFIAGSLVLAFSPLGQRLGTLGQFLSRLGGERTAVTRETVVLGIQSMSQLATAKYTIQTVVEVEQRGALGPLTNDRILLRANADVLAGIELGDITAANVQTNGENATITLPAPKLVSKDITYQVYDRQRGWFASANKDLQSAAEAQARAEIVATACEKGILKEAQTNAESALRAFLLNLGFKQVTFIATPPEAGTCKA
jgi:Protein of unknown function (DUF4230)